MNNNLTHAQLDELLGWLAEIVHLHGEDFLPIFETALAEKERRDNLSAKINQFRRTSTIDQKETAEQF